MTIILQKSSPETSSDISQTNGSSEKRSLSKKLMADALLINRILNRKCGKASTKRYALKNIDSYTFWYVLLKINKAINFLLFK